MQLLQISHREVNAVAICNSLPVLIRELKKKRKEIIGKGDKLDHQRESVYAHCASVLS